MEADLQECPIVEAMEKNVELLLLLMTMLKKQEAQE